MTATRSISQSQARRIALRAQGFGVKDRTTPVNRGHLRRLVRQMHIVQLDSVPVIVRTQYMPAFSRLGPYDTNLLDELAYRHDEWIEAFVHEASLVPVEDEPLLRIFKNRARRGETWKGLTQLAEAEADYIADVLQQVTERGPLKAAELDSPRPNEGEWWGSRSVGTLALDYLFRVGEVGIRRVGNFEKVFDLTDRIVPAEIRNQPTPDEDDAMRELLVRAAAALGLGTAACLVDYFRLPKRPAKALIPSLVEDGRLVQCDAEGVSQPVYMHPDAILPRSVDARALLSPFDPLVWNRVRGEWIFDFEYRIEIYVPKPKRQYGYYVMPFLLGDRLVGRCDLKTDRDTGTLRVIAAYTEPGVSDDIAPELADELGQLAQLVGVDSVTVDDTSALGKKLVALF